MTNAQLVNKTILNIQKLPLNKVQEVNDFVEFLLNKIDDQIITEGIKSLVQDSKTFQFLENEPNLYSVNDLKIRFDEKG